MKQPLSTTTEQSTRLLSCGVDPKTADMYYTNYSNKYNEKMPYIGEIGIRKDLIPAWSLSALIGLFDPEYCLSLTKHERDHYTVDSPLVYEIDCISGNDPIEVCAMMIEWLTANNYPLNKI